MTVLELKHMIARSHTDAVLSGEPVNDDFYEGLYELVEDWS